MAGLDQEQTEALLARIAQLEQERAHYYLPANYYEHRSPILSPPLERRDYEIKTSMINQMTQHQFYGLQGKHPINHNEERNQPRQRYEPGSIGFQLAAEQERDISYIADRWSQQQHEYQPGSIGFALSFNQERQNQSPTTNTFQPRQQPIAPPSASFLPTTSEEPLDYLEAMMQRMLLNQERHIQKMDARLGPPTSPQPITSEEPHYKLEMMQEQPIIKQQKNGEKTESMYADFNGKFESLSSHVQRLSLQVDQNAEWAKQRRGEQEPTEDSSRLVIPTTTGVDHKPRIKQEEKPTSTETCEQLQEEMQPDLNAQSVSKGNAILSTHVAEEPVDSPPSAIRETATQRDTTQVAIGKEPATKGVEPPELIFNPPSGTPLLITLQQKDNPRQFVAPSSINGFEFKGSMCHISGFQRRSLLSPPRRSPPKRIPRSPKMHPPDTGARIMIVARIHHQQLLYAKYSGVDGEDPWPNSQAKGL